MHRIMKYLMDNHTFNPDHPSLSHTSRRHAARFRQIHPGHSINLINRDSDKFILTILYHPINPDSDNDL